jgi:hypothetical protein
MVALPAMLASLAHGGARPARALALALALACAPIAVAGAAETEPATASPPSSRFT